MQLAAQTFLELERVAIATASSLAQPLGQPVTLAPGSETNTFSFTAVDPLIVENESRFQQLEETLRNAEAHASLMQDRALEHEEHVRMLTASFEASRAIAEANREAEAEECERRL